SGSLSSGRKDLCKKDPSIHVAPVGPRSQAFQIWKLLHHLLAWVPHYPKRDELVAFGYSEYSPHASVYFGHEQAHYRPVEPDAVFQSLKFDTPYGGSYFMNFSNSRVFAWDPLKLFEIVGLTECDEQRSDLPPHNP